MTDLQRTLEYLKAMGYRATGSPRPEGEDDFLGRFYHHDRLYIQVDRTSFTFNKDESLAGMGYLPPPYWKDEYVRTCQESKDFYEEDYDAFFNPTPIDRDEE